jgi:hypothetical protein
MAEELVKNLLLTPFSRAGGFRLTAHGRGEWRITRLLGRDLVELRVASAQREKSVAR